MTQVPLTFSSDVTVKMIRAMATDDMVVQAAQVSVKGENNPETDSPRLINYLLSSRHGCYDDETEVLTDTGWKLFAHVDGNEKFVTSNLITGEIQYEKAQRVIHEPYVGDMVHIKTQQVDLFVTPNHRLVGEARSHLGWNSHVQTFPAQELFRRCYRFRSGGGYRSGLVVDPTFAELLGFIIADGNVNNNSIQFHLQKSRKIEWLINRVTTIQSGDFYRIDASEELIRLAKATYGKNKDRVIPREVLNTWSSDSLSSLLDGYLEGDGSVSSTGKLTMSTVSDQLANDLQEIGLLAGGSIQYSYLDTERTTSYGTRPVHHLVSLKYRNSRPKIGWTTESRSKEVTTHYYEGTVHCVTVPSGTLYVRRNKKSLWCGNSPFEHCVFTFFVEAPLFVFREWQRHRISSFNEMSGRYTKLMPKFYTPDQNRKMVNVGTSARPEMAPGSRYQQQLQTDTDKLIARQAWDAYSKRLEAGISNELARTVLPLSVYSQLYWTVNARSLMNFISLRIDSEDSLNRSRPQWEIQLGAEKVEDAFAEAMPITHTAFVKAGRVAP